VHAGGPRLLLVEDETELAGMLRGLFVDEGYVVDVAANGQTGLHYGLTRSYDVVVLDRRLPVVEGLQLVRTWRQRGVTTPILVLSAQGSPPSGSRGSTRAPRTTWPSPSTSTNCWPGCAHCSGATSTGPGSCPSGTGTSTSTPAR
jgi:CheY-like chemotaxis protein